VARPLSAVARAKMLQAAAELALDVGVHGFTVDEVSRRSGIARTTIYRHFPNKNQLLIAALDDVTPAPRTPDTGTLRGDLLELLADLLPIFASKQVRALYLEIAASAVRDVELGGLQQSMMERRSGPTRTIFERAQERGEIAPHFDYRNALLIFEAPLVMRALGPAGSLDDFNPAVHVDQMLLVLQTQIPGAVQNS